MSDSVREDIGALEAHLRTHLEDWPSWLVYADVLLEQGDVRGQLITLAYRLETAELSVEECQSLHAQVKALTEAHQDEWLSGYKPLKGTKYMWRYGFVIGVKLPEREEPSLKKLFELCAHPTARFLTQLNLTSNHIGAEGARALAESEHLRALTLLNLYDNNIGAEGALALAQSRSRPQVPLCALTQLDLGWNNIGAAGARALAQSEHLRALTQLHLVSNHIGDEGARVLAHSEHLRALTRLNLTNNNIGAEGARALAQSEHLHALTELNLTNNNIGAEGACALAGSEYLHALTQLHLFGNNIGDEGARALVQSVTLRHCRVAT